jgi:ATP adenylyltransferase
MTERLWAPWRMEFLLEQRSAGNGCILCDYVGVMPGPSTMVLARRRHAYVVLNKYPYNMGHVMVVPNTHVVDTTGLSAEQSAAMFELLTDSIAALKRATHCHGINVGMNLGKAAGAGIEDHLHIHLVPRWTGDTNFMSVVSDTRVIPETLEQTRDLLAREFSGLTLDPET